MLLKLYISCLNDIHIGHARRTPRRAVAQCRRHGGAGISFYVCTGRAYTYYNTEKPFYVNDLNGGGKK